MNIRQKLEQLDQWLEDNPMAHDILFALSLLIGIPCLILIVRFMLGFVLP